MSVILLADLVATRPAVLLSPLAELGAALHRLGSVDHRESRWVARTRVAMPARLLGECDFFAGIWGGYRSRFLLPTAAPPADITSELARIAAMPPHVFAAQAGNALAGADVRRTARLSPDSLRTRARGRGCGPAAELLVSDAAAFRSRLLTVLERSWQEFFAAEWSALAPHLSLAAGRARQLLDGGQLTEALCRLVPASRVAVSPDRLIVDKLTHAVIDLSRRDMLLVPSVLGAPHVLVKHDPDFPAVVQFPARPEGRRRPVAGHLLRTRLRLLSEPTRLRVCRMLARHPRSTQELAETLRMTAPEMSRQLRMLREAGMVSSERQGRFVLYTLRHDVVASLGADLLNLLLR
ncbi:ArsR/SmtB family transcription factor [Fodinicola acaciae]|uniref:ArsR/SmtB family transcription factor n=1 Tax=Fodinicola acaciae TaxID=2681555 RepID=UPI0013D4E22C|nr:DUF5937 family protein [Fodinicola acaciae]